MIYRITAVDGDDEEVADHLRELHDEVFGDTAPQIDPSIGYWWIAKAADEVAGFCGVTPSYGDPMQLGYLKRAGVRLSHRGQGLQRRFIRVREARARKNGWTALVTDTTDNPSSANNLIACGYRIYTPQEPWGFLQTIYWTKEL